MDFLEVLHHTVEVVVLVFLMMVAVDWLDVKTRGRIRDWLSGKMMREYVLGSLLGVTPGCVGAFMGVSLYIHGFLGFGAIVGTMIATSGDEAFVMLAEYPVKALLLFAILFVLGTVLGLVTEIIARRLNLQPCPACQAQQEAVHHHTVRHYLQDHVWHHIIKKHLLRVTLWTFATLLLVEWGQTQLHLESLIKANLLVVLVLSAIVGLIPQSGPHLIFVVLFGQGVIPFSILLTSAVVQDGHGLLPLLSFTIRDTLLIKAFKFVYGLGLGLLLFQLGF